MTRAREQQIHLSETSYYHCVARCVRRAFLCGKDVASGQGYSHRKTWIVDKIKTLSGIFSLDDRVIQDDKKGAIPSNVLPILQKTWR